MLLNALITGLPSCCATHRLSGRPAFRFDAAVAMARIVVASIDHDHAIRRIGEQTGGQTRDVTTTRSTPRTASETETAVAPVSVASAERLSGPRELATKT